MNWGSLWSGIKNVGSGAKNLLFGSGNKFSGVTSSGPGVANKSGFGSNGILGGLNNLFGGSSSNYSPLMGMGMLGLGSMIPNAKAPAMPAEFTNYMSQLNQGGTPGMQSANQYYQGVLNGQNQGAYDAVTSSIQDEQEQERQRLEQMYKSLRPGSDLSSDSTFQRDMGALNDRYAKQLALARATVQSGAANALNQQGAQLAGLQGGAVQQYVDQIAQQWAMNQGKRSKLQDIFGNLGSALMSGPINIANTKALMGLFGRG